GQRITKFAVNFEQCRLPSPTKGQRGRRGGGSHRPPRFRSRCGPEDAMHLCGFRVVPGGPNAFIFRPRSGCSPPRRIRMSALSRIKCIRLLVAFGLCLMLAGPLMLLWASRPSIAPKGSGDDAIGQAFDHTDAILASRFQLPPATERPEGFAVFGDAFKTARRADNPKGLLRTNIADIDPANAEAVLRDLPDNLRFSEAEITRAGSKGILAAGVNYLMLKPEAIAAKSLDGVLGKIREQVKSIIGYGPNSTILVYVEPRQMAALRQNEDVKFIYAMQPADKIE